MVKDGDVMSFLFNV
ncbi:hypothetical protein B7457_23015 [Enterobacter hormaechei subsp. hoffmannii]|nr:hypothetical protein [Enterobacter hormaechei]ASB76663.1 hypothetical protein AM429_16375 [Enterobacter cloacae complex sp.]AVU22781.1 hypothetical protein AO413_12290 [Enterobacter cloacae]MCW4981455.1 hypothetical protein [Enterobacter hormaechei subsp. hoffmannii]MCM6990657.1 hypothetical protein [Enterobacter hormaechei]MCM7459403.1 hypothetical protein [Enterobacter hormaechei]